MSINLRTERVLELTMQVGLCAHKGGLTIHPGLLGTVLIYTICLYLNIFFSLFIPPDLVGYN